MRFAVLGVVLVIGTVLVVTLPVRGTKIVSVPVPQLVGIVPVVMDEGEATARAAALTGRLMQCFGSDRGWQCRPVGFSQLDHPELIIGPVVACYAGDCRVASLRR